MLELSNSISKARKAASQIANRNRSVPGDGDEPIKECSVDTLRAADVVALTCSLKCGCSPSEVSEAVRRQAADLLPKGSAHLLLPDHLHFSKCPLFLDVAVVKLEFLQLRSLHEELRVESGTPSSEAAWQGF